MQESRRRSRVELMLLSRLTLGLCMLVLTPSSCARGGAGSVPGLEAAAARPQGSAVLVHSAELAPEEAHGGPRLAAAALKRRAPEPSPDAALEPAPALPEGTTVLHIGDSFAGALGIPLNKRLKQAGVRGVLKYRTASYIVEWAHAGDLEHYLNLYQPDLVLITLGANELEIDEPERRIPAIQKIVAKVGRRPCVWVGVPLWDEEHNGLMEIVRDHAAPCRFMDSAALYPDMPRADDKIHPTMQAREDWAVKVADWLARERRPTEGQAWALSAR